MADSYEAEQMPGVGAVLMRHKVTSPRWIMGLMSGVPLGVGGVVAAGLAIGGFFWSALGAFAGGLALAALFAAINVTFASARIAVSEGELHVQLGLAGPRIPIASIRGVHVGPSGRNKSGMGVSKDLRGKTWYTLWGDNAHAVHVEHVRVRGAVGPVANRGDAMGRTQLVACLLTSLLGASCAEAHSRSLSLVLADLHIEPRDEAGRAAGVDLDGLDTTAEGRTCTHSSLDHVSLYDDSERGVDNLMAALPPSGVTRTVASSPRPSVQDGSYLLAIRVDGIDSFADDEAVAVTVRRVELAGCRSGGPCRPILEGDRLAADQRFVAAGPELAGVGSIADGRLRAELPELAVPAVAWFPASEHPGFEHRLRGVRLEADIDATGLQRGTMGGSLPVEDVLRLLSLARPDIPIEEVEPILVNMADLEPQAGGECASMSVGLSLSAVRATPE